MSSHREAPEMSKDPVADSTDVYAFVSPDDPTTATLIANYVPLQAPDGGPNFYEFGNDVLYEIHIDNDGDALANVTYQFKFTSVLSSATTFLYNTGPITITNGRLNLASWHRRQYFSVTKVVGTKSTVLASNLACPPCNIGPLSTPNYNDAPSTAGDPEDFTKAFIYTLPSGEKVFAGQRAEGFYVDLGAIFDLGNLRPIAEAHNTFGTGAVLSGMPGVNSTAAVNVHSIAIQVPIPALAKGGVTPTNVTSSDSVVGVWTTASRQTATMRNSTGTPTYSGPYVQVSRLANPLFNEVLVPLAQKDYWNASPPSGDKTYAPGVDQPVLAVLLPTLFPGAFPNLQAYNNEIANGTKPLKRADLDAILLTGIPAATLGNLLTTYTGSTKADLLRLNLAVPPTSTTAKTFSNLGIVGGDVAGFPNGRRVYDDVTTIELQAIAGLTIPLIDDTYVVDTSVKSGEVTPGLTTGATDVTAEGSVKYLTSFPYLGTPHSGYETPNTTPPADQQTNPEPAPPSSGSAG
jgi:hypothetical protein